ncbi:MAG TPA: glycoside hydrolase family 16 protein [Arthrobacter sp.]
MSASTDQSRAEARRHEKKTTPLTTSASLLKKATRPRNLALAAALVAALAGSTAFGLASSPTDMSLASSKSDQAPGRNKDVVPISTATATTTAAPAPTATATTTAAPAPTATATSAPLATTSGPVPAGVPGAWSLKFDDEFNGTALDGTKWSNCWFAPSCGSMNNVSTSPANVSVSGGNLILNLSSSTSGSLVSTNPSGGASTGYQFTTGYVEARIKFPGDGTNLYNWPAFWTTGQSWPATGENDIAEVLSGKMTVNYHSSSGSHNQGSVPGYWGGSFHTFGLDRKATSSDVYFDGVKVKSYATDDGNAPEYLVLNVGASGSGPAAYGAASQLQVDYVRAWQ